MGILRRCRKRTSRSGETGNENPTTTARVLSRIVERGTRVQRPAVRAYLDRLRAANPGAGPAEIATKLEKRYLAAVTASGAAVGSSATIPAIGTLTALSAIGAETVVFLEATALFVLAVAEVHDIPADQWERRRALVLAVLVGDDGRQAVGDLLGSGRTGGAWLAEGSAGVMSLPLPAVAELNRRLVRYFVKRYTVRRGALMFGKLLPLGVGAMVGGVGNRAMGKKIITNARNAFGPAPSRWPVTLRLVPAVGDGGPGPAGGTVARLPDRKPNG